MGVLVEQAADLSHDRLRHGGLFLCADTRDPSPKRRLKPQPGTLHRVERLCRPQGVDDGSTRTGRRLPAGDQLLAPSRGAARCRGRRRGARRELGSAREVGQVAPSRMVRGWSCGTARSDHRSAALTGVAFRRAGHDRGLAHYLDRNELTLSPRGCRLLGVTDGWPGADQRGSRGGGSGMDQTRSRRDRARWPNTWWGSEAPEVNGRRRLGRPGRRRARGVNSPGLGRPWLSGRRRRPGPGPWRLALG